MLHMVHAPKGGWNGPTLPLLCQNVQGNWAAAYLSM
jgi:hypothetical protein